jgi:UDP-glucose 4-epimerase
VNGQETNKIFSGETLLITGGTGSFGNAVLRHFLNMDLKEIRIFSRDEKKQDDMRKKYQNSKIKFYIGDVRSKDSVENAVRGVDYIFHAAALKQVPSCEFFPLEAVATNVIGTDNVLGAAIQSGVKKVIVLSTDKAAYPINAMGMSKALMEKVAVARSRDENSGTVICRTRYGNVMASRGSVIPLFARQILAGGPVTVTNAEMTRFMMTLDESVALVFFAFQHGQPGDLFVQKAPAATIGVLAEALMEKLGKRVDVKVIGTRHGEKQYEVLVTREEMVSAEDMGDFYRVRADNRDLNYEKYMAWGDESLDRATEYSSDNTERLTVAGMRALLDRIDIDAALEEGC